MGLAPSSVLARAEVHQRHFLRTRSGWSGRAPAPAAIGSAKGRQRQGARSPHVRLENVDDPNNVWPNNDRHLRRSQSILEAWTSPGRVLRRLGERNASRVYGPNRLAVVPQSVLRGGSSESHDLHPALHFAYRNEPMFGKPLSERCVFH
jgi:hypothetical protein